MDDSLTKLFTNGRVLGQGYFDQLASSTKQLAIEVSDLHAGEDGVLRLTCVATIPAYVSYNEQYADIRNRSVNSKFFLFFFMYKQKSFNLKFD